MLKPGLRFVRTLSTIAQSIQTVCCSSLGRNPNAIRAMEGHHTPQAYAARSAPFLSNYPADTDAEGGTFSYRFPFTGVDRRDRATTQGSEHIRRSSCTIALSVMTEVRSFPVLPAQEHRKDLGEHMDVFQ